MRALSVVAAVVVCGSVFAGSGDVSKYYIISAETPELARLIDRGDFFGSATACLGDLDGDTIPEVAVGARGDDDGGEDHGAVYILFLQSEGRIRSCQKLSETSGGLNVSLPDSSGLGSAAAAMGDLDGDGIADLAAGLPGFESGRVLIVFMNADGTVKSTAAIDPFSLNLSLPSDARFGQGLACVGDVDGDGVVDLAAGAPGDHDGTVWILFMNANGTVKSCRELEKSEVDSPVIGDGEQMGFSLCALADMNGDGIHELAVGSPSYVHENVMMGLTRIAYLNRDGTAGRWSGILPGAGGLEGEEGGAFGSGLSGINDLDMDGVGDIAIGTPGRDRSGAVRVLLLYPDGSVKSAVEISNGRGGLDAVLSRGDGFGVSVSAMADYNGDGIGDLVIGAEGDDAIEDGGAVYLALLYDCRYRVPGDLNRDCRVDTADLAVIAHAWLVNCELAGANADCAPVEAFLSCGTSFADCDLVRGNGCEINLLNNPGHCGRCGHGCTFANGTAACVNGACTGTCGAGFSDCDRDAANGCEINTAQDVNHCGLCGHVCQAPPYTHVAQVSCVQGDCRVAQCAIGYGDCEGSISNGCEQNHNQTAYACSSPYNFGTLAVGQTRSAFQTNPGWYQVTPTSSGTITLSLTSGMAWFNIYLYTVPCGSFISDSTSSTTEDRLTYSFTGTPTLYINVRYDNPTSGCIDYVLQVER